MEWNGEGGNPFYQILTYLSIFLPPQIGGNGMEYELLRYFYSQNDNFILSSITKILIYCFIPLEYPNNGMGYYSIPLLKYPNNRVK